VFVVQAAAPAKPKPAKPPAKPAAKKAAAPAKPAEEDDANPYGVTQESLAPRCPHCAAELEDGEAVICLNCGYNTKTRFRHETTKTIEHNGLDWTLWLAPPIFCVFLFFGLIGCIVFLWTGLTPIIEENKDAWWAFAPRAGELWGTIFCLAIM